MIRFLVHKILGSKKTDDYIKEFARKINNKVILEVGSGKKVKNNYKYSFKRLFNKSNTFIQSDMNPKFGHKVLNVNKMNYKNKFDIIICASVLEHNFYFQEGIEKIYKALKKDGIALITVPALYPLHDEPNDYWRFTEHSLRKLLFKFKNLKIKRTGFRKLPFLYIVEARK